MEPGIGLFSMMALMMGALLGPGLLALPGQLAEKGSAGIQLLAWVGVALGVSALSYLMQTLARGSDAQPGGWPELQRQIDQKLGARSRFVLAWGYWCSAWMGNLAYTQLIWASLLTYLGPWAASLPTWVGVSLVLWGVDGAVRRWGAEQSVRWNTLLTAIKLALIFGVALTFAHQWSSSNFQSHIQGAWCAPKPLGSWNSVLRDGMQAALAMAWLFVGFEGSLLLGHRAKKGAQLERAQSLALFFVALLLMAFWVLSMGAIAPQGWKGWLPQQTLEVVQSAWGVKVGCLFSFAFLIFLQGALLSWTLLAAELAVPCLPLKSREKLGTQSCKKAQASDFALGLRWTTLASQGGALLAGLWGWDYGALAALSTLCLLPNYAAILWVLSRHPLTFIGRMAYFWAALCLGGLACGGSLAEWGGALMIFAVGACWTHLAQGRQRHGLEVSH